MASSVSIAQLQALPLFADLDATLLAHLAQQSQSVQYVKDEILFQEGDALPARLHILVSGRLRIAKLAPSGKETILRILSAGEVFAAPALFGNGQSPALVTALEAVTVLWVDRAALLEGFAQTPDLALRLLGLFNQRLQQLHYRVHGLVSERAIVRLVHYLEFMADCFGTDPVANGEQLRSRLDHYQIARSIGITYEECVRLFKQLKIAVIYRRGGQITICDRHQLHAFSTNV
ncbi:MAG: Crp/Fnr family transcriptional regulator [Cyanobacteria bacterium P01_G01_bin.54]